MTVHARFVPARRRDDIPEIGVGILGYGFMGRAHTNAYRTMPSMFWPPAARPRLVAICGRTEARVAAGFQDVLVTEAHHPFARVWWPRGHTIGWERAHVNQLYHFVDRAAGGGPEQGLIVPTAPPGQGSPPASQPRPSTSSATSPVILPFRHPERGEGSAD